MVGNDYMATHTFENDDIYLDGVSEPPTYDIVPEHSILCEYCGRDWANTSFDLWMMPFLLCDDCVQLSIDDAHYAIGIV